MITTVGVGIGLAFIAMLCWGFGDFLIQKSTRTVGDWETLFLISFVGALVTLPFVWHRLPSLATLSQNDLLVILAAAVTIFIAALVEFEALKRGKLSVVEPIWSLEVPVAAVLAFCLVSEHISTLQIVLIATLIICLILVGLRQRTLSLRILFERGVFLAFLGAIFMGAANFFMGWGGRVTDALTINFVTDLAIFIFTGIYLWRKKKVMRTFKDFVRNLPMLLPMSIADKTAWVAFVFAMTLAPIAVATALSESYIIIAVLLGLVINREKLHSHQKVGLIGSIIAALILAVISST